MNEENIKKIVKNNSGQRFIIDMTHSILNKNFSLEKKENTKYFFFKKVFTSYGWNVFNQEYAKCFKCSLFKIV